MITKTFGVLLVDDVSDLRTLIRIALEAEGHFKVIAEAGDGVEAVELAEVHKPDLVVLDLSMPRQDGLESLPKILSASPDSKVIVLSGFEVERLGATARRLGAFAYLEKGSPPAELLVAARAAVGLPADQPNEDDVVRLDEEDL